jgi:dolichol kinase
MAIAASSGAVLLAVVIIAFFYHLSKKKMAGSAARFAVMFVASAAVYAIEGGNVPFLAVGSILFYLVGILYGTSAESYASAAGILYALAAAFYTLPALAVQPVLFGLLASVKPARADIPRSNLEREVKRDVFQISIGILPILAFYFIGMGYAPIILIILVMLGAIIASQTASKKGKGAIGRFLSGMEREYVHFGDGAMWLAIGALTAAAVLANSYYIALAMVAVFIGDAVATIAGIRLGGMKLPYNRKKRLSGLVANFVVVGIIGYFMVGPVLGFAVAAISAIIESIKLPIDDNFAVALAVAIVLAAA